jgi:hypothetical protein
MSVLLLMECGLKCGLWWLERIFCHVWIQFRFQRVFGKKIIIIFRYWVNNLKYLLKLFQMFLLIFLCVIALFFKKYFISDTESVKVVAHSCSKRKQRRIKNFNILVWKNSFIQEVDFLRDVIDEQTLILKCYSLKLSLFLIVSRLLFSINSTFIVHSINFQAIVS